MGYKKGECRLAEETARDIISLPTHIKVSPKEAEEIARLIKLLASQR